MDHNIKNSGLANVFESVEEVSSEAFYGEAQDLHCSLRTRYYLDNMCFKNKVILPLEQGVCKVLNRPNRPNI